jgi:MFS family permease
MGMPYSVLLPVFATEVLHGGPYTLGLLSTAAGVGALGGALFLAARRSVLGLGRVIIVATVVFGSSLLLFSQSQVLWLSLLALIGTGFGMMVMMAACNTILQTIVEDSMRGRVMSFYSMAFLGVAPFGSLFAGLLAERIGAESTVLVGGITCLVGAACFGLRLPRLRPLVRPIYARLGILPAVAAGMQSATDLTRRPVD